MDDIGTFLLCVGILAIVLGATYGAVVSQANTIGVIRSTPPHEKARKRADY